MDRTKLKRVLDNSGYVSVKDRSYELTANDGTKLGAVSYGAKKAIESNTIDSYKPKNDTEKSILEKYKQHIKDSVIEIPVNDKKTIKLKHGIVSDIENFLKDDPQSKVYELDDKIAKMGLGEEEYKNAMTYAGVRKLELASEATGRNSVWKELGQPITKFFYKQFRRVQDVKRFIFDSGFGTNNDYNEWYADVEKYYAENPDELGHALFLPASSRYSGNAWDDYVEDVKLDKMMEVFKDTTTVSQFISDYGFGTAGEMSAMIGMANMLGLSEVPATVGNIFKSATTGTKIGKVAEKIANISPKISAVAGNGAGKKVLNKGIGAINSVSIGSTAKFLNPLDNTTTFLMGATSAQEKYRQLRNMGYDDSTAVANSLFTAYVNAITEKLGYDGTPESMFLFRGKALAGAASGSAVKNTKNIIKKYLSTSASEGLEEVYATVFERLGDCLLGVGYTDEKGDIQKRKFVGNQGVIDLKNMGESFLGGFVGGAVMGGAGVLGTIALHNVDAVHQYADEVHKKISAANEDIIKVAKAAGVEDISLPKEPNWSSATVEEINDYYEKSVDEYEKILNNESVVKNDATLVERAVESVNAPESFTHYDRANSEIVYVEKTEDGNYSVTNAAGFVTKKTPEAFAIQYAELTEYQKELLSGENNIQNSLQNASNNGIVVGERNIEEVNQNANIRKHDGVGETQLREAQEEGLYGRGNQTDTIGNQTDTARTQRKGLQSDWGEHTKEQPQKGTISSQLHGTPYVFTNHLKSYTDLGIHYGTEDQAKNRLPNGRGNIIQGALKIEKPLITEDIFGERTPEQYVEEIVNNSKLSENEKTVLQDEFALFLTSDIGNRATESLIEKLSTGKHQIKTNVERDGLFVSLSILDDASNIYEVPLTELIEVNKVVEILGDVNAEQILKSGELTDEDIEKLEPYLFEAVLPFEKQFLQLRKIEEILQSFGYDGFAYQNENEGDGWSYAVFDDSQIIRESETDTPTEETSTITGELDEIASTEMPTVSVGDTFIESGSNKIIKVIDRGDTHATVEITTPSGAKETKQLRLAAIDNMAVDDKYTKVETSAPQNTESADTPYDIMSELGLTYDEQRAIIEYKSSESYTVNDLLRVGKELSNKQKVIKKGLNSALKKFPAYKGIVYRNIGFMTREDFSDFILEHTGKTAITYPAFTSASKTVDGYVVEAPYLVHYEIESVNGRDVSQLGIKSEKEILFATDTTFEIAILKQSERELFLNAKEVKVNGESKSDAVLEERGEQHGVQKSGSETEYRRANEEAHSTSNIVRGGGSAYDEVYSRTPESNSGGTDGRSGEYNQNGITKAGNASVREGELPRVDSVDADIAKEKQNVNTTADGTAVSSTDVDATDAEISTVVDVMEETFEPGAKEDIFASMENSSLPQDITIFAQSLIRQYKKTGTLGHIAKYFTDDGKKVIDAIDAITLFSAKDNYSENLKNSKDVTVLYEKKEDTLGSDLTAENVPLGNTEEISSAESISHNSDIVNSSILRETENAAENPRQTVEDASPYRQGNVEKVTRAIERTLRDDIKSNPELMNMLSDRFGDDGFKALASDIILTYERDGSIGNHEVLFLDNGAEIYEALSEPTGNEMRASIANIKGKQQVYGEGVYLDTNIFDGVKPRAWNSILAKYVYENLAGKSITVYNDNEKSETINFAKINERVKKDGAKNSHKVIDKLARAKGNINSLAIVHIDELLQTSKQFDTSEDNSHQWLDQNGWEYRKAYLIDKKGQIYETTLNIAKARDGRNILYSLSNTKKVDDGVVFSTSIEEELARNDQLSLSTISQKDKVVNTNIRKNLEKDTQGGKINDAEQQSAGGNILSGSGKWAGSASAGEQVGGFSAIEFKNQGRTEVERKSTAEELRADGQTEEKIIDIKTSGKRGKVRVEVIKPESYNEDMRAIKEEYEAMGINVHLYVGDGRVAFDAGGDYLVNGLVIGGSDVYLRYDGKHAPQNLGLHERIHLDWDTDEVQAIKNDMLGSLSQEEKDAILSMERYQNYIDMYNGNMDAVWQEFVADVLAGMNEYTDTFYSLVSEYWDNNSTVVDNFKVSEYTESIDAGGTNNDVSEVTDYDNLKDIAPALNFTFAIKRVKMKVFPPYDKSKSEANERATRWAHKVEVDTGAQKLISYHNRWYVIEKFESLELEYQIMGAVSTKEVNSFINEVKKRENEFKRAKQRVFDGLTNSAEKGKSVGIRGYDFGNNADQHGREVKTTQGLDKNQNERGTHPGNSRRIVEQDGADRKSTITGDERNFSRVDNNEMRASLAGSNTEFWDEWLTKINEYGAIPKGEKPVRDVDVSNLPERPVLVRERMTEVDRVEFTRKANESSIGSLSATEQARVDAEKLTGDILNLLVTNDNGTINTSANKDFISAVITKVFKSEDLNNVVNADGMLSARGLERIKNAIFYKAYGDASLSARLAESLDNDMKNATNVLLNIAPKVVYVKNGIASGNLYDFDFSEDIASAVRLFEKCRNENSTVNEYASQTTMFEKETQIVMAMAYVFETKNRGAKQATDFYNLLLDTVIDLGDPNQIKLETVEIFQTKDEILNETIERYNNGVESKNTITISESIYRPESIARGDDDGRGIDEVSGNQPDENEKTKNAVGVQQDNRRGKETGVVADDEQLRQKNESIEGQSEVKGESGNEQTRSYSLSKNSRRGHNGGTRKQVERISYFERKNQGRNAKERQSFARELIKRGQAEEVIKKIGKYTYKYTLVKPEYYNDDMLSMVEEAKKKGVELGFFIGNAKVNFDSKDAFLIDGIKINDSQILVQYDEDLSPQKIFKHELIHAKWKTRTIQAIKNTIIGNLTETDKNTILSTERMQRYQTIYKNNKGQPLMDIVWEEFVCDVMSGMSDYTANYIDTVADFWYGNESVDSYNAAEYSEIIDAGGTKISKSNNEGKRYSIAEKGNVEDEKTRDNRKRTERLPEEFGNQRRWDSGNSENLSDGNPKGEIQSSGGKVDGKGQTIAKGSRVGSVDRVAPTSDSAFSPGRTRTEGERFLVALREGDDETARTLLNEQAVKSGFVPAHMYHGTLSDDVFTQFESEVGIHWVTPSLKYAEKYTDGYFGDDIKAAQLFTELDSGVYDLYIKPGKVLDVGNINLNYDNLDVIDDFLRRVGLSHEEYNRCWREGKKHEYRQLWTVVHTSSFAKIARERGYDSIRATERDGVQTYGCLYPENLKSAKLETFDDNGNLIPLEERFNEDNKDIRYNLADSYYAPTFYSHMGKTIDEMKQDKIGANSVVSYLKGRGVKDEEIKWSGIETFLDGKKSVTKAELQEFVAGSQLQIEEQELGETVKYTEEQHRQLDRIDTDKRHLREGVYELWGKLLPNTDLLDFMATDDTITMLSRMANAVKKSENADTEDANRLLGYLDEIDSLELEMRRIIAQAKSSGQNTAKWSEYKLDGGDNYREITFKMPDSDYTNNAMKAHWGDNAKGILAHARVQDFEVDGNKMLFIEEIQSDWHNEGAKKGYVGKVAEPALSNYEIRKVGNAPNRRDHFVWALIDKQSGIRVASIIRATEQEAWDELTDYLVREEVKSQVPDAPFRNNYHEYVLKSLIRMAAEQGYDSIGWTPAGIQSERWLDQYAEGYRIEYDQDIPKFLNKYGKKWGAKVGQTTLDNGNNVWSMDITDSMRDSVLYEGQARYSLATDGILDLEDLWEDAKARYGTIPKGEKPVRDVDVPKKISEKDVVSQHARTMIEAGVTPDWAVSEFEQRILDGTMTHEVITNKKASTWARQQIEHLGFEEALNRWSVWSDSGKVGKKELALGMELYNQCITNKDVHNAMKIASELVTEATHAGQTLQAARMLKLMTPDGQLYYLEKSIQKMNEEFKEKLGDKYKDIELDESLMEEFLTEKDEEKRNEVYDMLCQDIADQIPTTWYDKWTSWRYLAMLGNPKTHIRNIVGNAVFVPAIRIKNYVGAVIESAAGIKAEDRTKSLRKSKAAVEFAKKDFETMAKILQGENAKYAVTSDIEGKRTIFKTKQLEKIRLKNFEFLEKEDMWFLRMHYVDALARIITVRGLDVNTLSRMALENARAYAIKEAQAATYRDANCIAEGLNKLQRKLENSDNKSVRAMSVLIEDVMPFKKTPLNIAKQGIKYSPIGILKGVYKGFVKLKNGEVTAADVIDDLSKGLTGTAVMILGYFLASMGLLVGAGDKPKKEKEFDKMVGEQTYAFKIEDAFSYTIDWMTPSNLSLFVGAKLYDLTKDDLSFADVVGALSTVTEPLLELSVFSGINSVIESAQYSDSEALVAIGSNMATSYLLQALPTIGGQISRMIDKNKREYYFVDKNSNMPKGLQRLIGQAASKIPFASYLFEPSIDEWGREEEYGNVFERIFENTVSPGYYAEDNYTKVDKELRRLYEETGETSVLPTTQQKYYVKDKVYYYMSAEDYTEVKKLRGKTSFKLVSDLLSSSRYKSMSDAEKVKALKKCYEEAGEKTKEKMFDKVKSSTK